MNISKSLLALAVSSTFCCAAHAQSQITIYGTVDIAAYYADHMLSQDPIVGAPADPQVSKYASGAVTGLTNGGLSQSRIGFKGSEELGDGLKAFFVLETRFNPNDGAIANSVGSVANLGSSKNPLTSGGDGSVAGQLFNGQAAVGLSSAGFGSVALGRVTTFGADAIGFLDPMKGSLTFSPLGYSGQYAGAGFTEDARSDNSIKYTYASNGYNFGVMYKMGEQTGNTSAQSAFGLTAGYANGPLMIQAVYAQNKDAVSAGAPGVPASNPAAGLGQLALTFADTSGFLLGATYQLDKFKFAFGGEYMTYNNPSNPALDATTSQWFGYPVYGTPNTTAYTNEKKQTMFWLGATYSASSALDLTAAYYQAHQNDYSGGLCATSNVASGACAGNNLYASLMADYKFSKRTDVYAGFMHNRVSGGYDVIGTLNNSDNFFATGIRHSF